MTIMADASWKILAANSCLVQNQGECDILIQYSDATPTNYNEAFRVNHNEILSLPAPSNASDFIFICAVQMENVKSAKVIVTET